MRIRSLSHSAVEIMWHAGRQAAACNNKRWRRLDACNRSQAFLPLNIAERGTREDQPKLLAGRLVKNRNILARVVQHWNHNAAHGFALNQRSKQLPVLPPAG
jgi:hypothetical protein